MGFLLPDDVGVALRALPAHTDRPARCAAFIRLLWPSVQAVGASWMGFYTDDPLAPPQARLVLGAREPKPACSPIGVHGACGRCVLTARILVIRDVAVLGPNYVACDPRDRSELVIPCLEPNGRAWGVLDLDSFAAGAFSGADAALLWDALAWAGLTTGGHPGVDEL